MNDDFKNDGLRDLIVERDGYLEQLEEAKEEIDRLNNIINALEESYVEDIRQLESFGEGQVEVAEVIKCYRFYLNRLKELKEEK